MLLEVPREVRRARIAELVSHVGNRQVLIFEKVSGETHAPLADDVADMTPSVLLIQLLQLAYADAANAGDLDHVEAPLKVAVDEVFRDFDCRRQAVVGACGQRGSWLVRRVMRR